MTTLGNGGNLADALRACADGIHPAEAGTSLHGHATAHTRTVSPDTKGVNATTTVFTRTWPYATVNRESAAERTTRPPDLRTHLPRQRAPRSRSTETRSDSSETGHWRPHWTPSPEL